MPILQRPRDGSSLCLRTVCLRQLLCRPVRTFRRLPLAVRVDGGDGYRHQALTGTIGTRRGNWRAAGMRRLPAALREIARVRLVASRDSTIIAPRAGMAELVDAPDSKSGSGNRVWVRFPLPAPAKNEGRFRTGFRRCLTSAKARRASADHWCGPLTSCRRLISLPPRRSAVLCNLVPAGVDMTARLRCDTTIRSAGRFAAGLEPMCRLCRSRR